MRRLLVTGGAGFIGSNFAHYWLRTHPEERLVILDALTYAGNARNLSPIMGHPSVRFVHGDIRNLALVEQLLREERIDTVVHFAAESHVDRSIVQPDDFIQTNIIGTYTLLTAARRYWLDEKAAPSHRFHHVSTDEVYGALQAEDPPFTESTPYAPNSPYSASKAASDHLVRAYHHTYGLSTTTSNCSNNYGPYQFPEKLIPLMILNALRGKPLPVYGDGGQIRDWLHVEDHCRGIDLVLSKGRIGETYNIGSRNEHPNLHVVGMICDLVDELFASTSSLKERFPDAPAARGHGTRSLISFVRDRPGHDRRYAIDGARAERALGYRASVQFEQGLRDTIRWYVDHEPWWQEILAGSYRDWIAGQYEA